MTILEANRIVKRVISEVAGTVQTNGIQELDHTEYGGVSTFGYVYNCLISTAYNSVRALPGFSYSYNEFFKAVDAEETRQRAATFVDVSTITEYGLTQKLSNSIRVF